MVRHQVDYWIKNKSIDVSIKDIIGPVAIHWHEFYEIELILSGGGIYIIDGVEYPIYPGCMFFMSPSSFHHIDFQEPTRLINIMFTLDACDIDFLTGIFSITPHIFLQIPENEIHFFMTLAEEMVQYTASNTSIDSYMITLLSCYLGKLRNLHSNHNISANSSGLQYAILYLQNHFTEPLSLQDIAKEANYSPNYFNSQFKDHVGMSFKQYLMELRFAFVRKLLIHTDLPLQQIAEKCGFHDLSYFFSSFKHKYGITPKQCRESANHTL